MKKIDLHTHTTSSDGTLTPSELVKYAYEKNLSAVAITDHDTLNGIEEAKIIGDKIGVEVISGIEVSTEYEGVEVHIVGLFVDRFNEELKFKLNNMRYKRSERNKLMALKLADLGLDITYYDIVNQAKGGTITRAHFAKVLKEKGYVSSNQEAFDRFLGQGKPAYVKRECFNLKDTINMINNAGGVAILAHPLLYKFSKARLENAVSEMAGLGLKGIEAYYSTHSLSDTKYIKLIADKNRLKLSGGSDFHGANKPKLDLGVGYGNLEVPYDVLEALKGVINNG
ncbi:MAG: PHP domain-containing protein [Lachnospirales bacterium]